MKKLNTILFIFAIFLSCTSNDIGDAPSGTFTNPLLESGADPWVFYHDGYYYYTNTLSNKIGIWRTKDLSELKTAE